MASAIRPMGKWERLARERHARDYELAQRPEGHPRGFWFDPEAGQRPIDFIEQYCCHYEDKWAGKPLKLEEWQKEIIRSIYGWKKRDGSRRYRVAWVEVARKNGKSTLVAALSLYGLIADQQQGGQVYNVATKRDQARIVFRACVAMVKSSPELKRFVKPMRNTLVCARLNAKMEPLSSDANTLDGLNPTVISADECARWTDSRLWYVLDTSMGARTSPLMLAITTGGVYDQEAIGWVQHDYAHKVLEGTIEDDTFYAFIAARDEGDDPYSEETLKKANPCYGVSISADYLQRQAEKAKNLPDFQNEYLRDHLNDWTQQVTRRIPVERWNACDGTPIDEDGLAGRECFGGLDLSTKLDLTALVLAFPGEDKRLDLLCRFWLPEQRVRDALQKGQKFYAQWAAEGWIKTTPGDVVDYDFIRAEVNELGKKYRIQEIAFDPWGATQISTQLQSDGFVTVETRQGFRSLSEPFKEFEARIFAGKIRHGGNPVLRYCISNTAVDTDAAGNVKPAKDKSSGRIDGVVAATMALSALVADDGGDVFRPFEGGFARL